MLQFSTGTRQQLPPQLFEQMGHYRREVFINQLGWELNTTNGMELDEFDGPDAVYVCSQGDEGNVNGVARLLPTTGPYLMEKVFPQLWGESMFHATLKFGNCLDLRRNRSAKVDQLLIRHLHNMHQSFFVT